MGLLLDTFVIAPDEQGYPPTVLLTSLGKTFFAWRFILNENLLF